MINMAKAMGCENADKASDFIEMLHELKVACGVDGLRMSDYGITEDEFESIAKHARSDSGGLYDFDPCVFSDSDAVEVLKKAYK